MSGIPFVRSLMGRKTKTPTDSRWRRVFESRNLALLWLGQTVSIAGDSVYEKALLWLMLELTGSSGLTGLVAMSAYLPTLIIGAWAGVVVDRCDHRRIMITADVARAGLVLIIPLFYAFGNLNFWSLFLITFLVASGAAFFNPARDSMVPRLVSDESQLLKANAIIQSSWMFALVLGPGLAFLALDFLGFSAVHLFYADSVTFAISTLCIAAIVSPRDGDAVARKRKPVFHELMEGLRLAVGDRRVRWLLIVTAVDNLFIMGPAGVGMVIFVRSVLHEGIGALMLIEGCYAIGMIVGTAALPLWRRWLSQGRILLLGMILDGVTFIPLLWVDTLWGTAITIVVHSLAIPMLVVIRPALVQRIVPKHMQGRVFSLIGVTVVGLTALSSGLTGIAAEFVSMHAVFGAIGVGAGLCGLWGWSIRELRKS
jgi:MFS transporter, DHA3 family, macrolide efflux protein